MPFRIENLEPDGAMRLHLSSRHWLDAYDPSWESHIKKLIYTVSSHLETTIAEEDVEVPETLQRKQTTFKNKGIRAVLVGIVTAALIISAGWYGLTQINKTGGETRELNLSLTEQVVATLEENAEIQETVSSSSEDPPSATQTIAAAMVEQGEVTQETISDPCQIAFYSDRSGYSNIWLMEPDGSSQTQLSYNQYGDGKVSWSPDGTQLTFDSGRDGDSEIFIMNADGTNIRQLTANEIEDMYPDWSPDGEQIAFSSNRYGDDEIFVMNTDGTNIRQLTSNNGGSQESDWSPDGRIAFASNRSEDWEIWIMDADGSNQQQLTFNEGLDLAPVWSPLCK